MGLRSKSFRFEGGGRQSENGLRRTGKSCRLRWVNYLRPDLRRGKMTPHEEQLVLELHAKWGNRWSRIARKIPGRTDNEIKNYWRTHTRKRAQEMKQTSSPPSYSSYSSSSSSSINAMAMVDDDKRSFYDTGGEFAPSLMVSNNSCSSFDTNETKYYDMGGLEMLIPKKMNKEEEKKERAISMDDIWKDIELSESEHLHNPSSETMISPIWNYCPDSLWAAEEEVKMREMVFPPINDNLFACYSLEGKSLTG